LIYVVDHHDNMGMPCHLSLRIHVELVMCELSRRFSRVSNCNQEFRHAKMLTLILYNY